MRVSELITMLQAMPRNAEVLSVYDSAAVWEEVKDVRLVQSRSWCTKGEVVAILVESAADYLDEEDAS